MKLRAILTQTCRRVYIPAYLLEHKGIRLKGKGRQVLNKTSTFSLHISAFPCAHGKVQNVRIRTKPEQMSFCVRKLKPENPFSHNSKLRLVFHCWKKCHDTLRGKSLRLPGGPWSLAFFTKQGKKERENSWLGRGAKKNNPNSTRVIWRV